MTLLMENAQKRRLRRLVSKAFLSAGWQLTEQHRDTHDFVVTAQNIRFLVKCLDSGISKFQSANKTIAEAQSATLDVKARLRRTLLFVIEDNFLGADLNELSKRQIFFSPIDNLHDITDLSAFGDRAPYGLVEWQTQLLTCNSDYSLFVSRLLRKSGDFEEAAYWAYFAVESSAANLEAYLNLIQVLMRLKAFDKAEEIGRTMLLLRPNDINVLRALRALASQRGQDAELPNWDERIADASRQPTDFEQLLDNRSRSLPKVERQSEHSSELPFRSVPWYRKAMRKLGRI
jgi:tetratricopeptide (TPR) repeat protein